MAFQPSVGGNCLEIIYRGSCTLNNARTPKRLPSYLYTVSHQKLSFRRRPSRPPRGRRRMLFANQLSAKVIKPAKRSVHIIFRRRPPRNIRNSRRNGESGPHKSAVAEVHRVSCDPRARPPFPGIPRGTAVRLRRHPVMHFLGKPAPVTRRLCARVTYFRRRTCRPSGSSVCR